MGPCCSQNAGPLEDAVSDQSWRCLCRSPHESSHCGRGDSSVLDANYPPPTNRSEAPLRGGGGGGRWEGGVLGGARAAKEGGRGVGKTGLCVTPPPRRAIFFPPWRSGSLCCWVPAEPFASPYGLDRCGPTSELLAVQISHGL